MAYKDKFTAADWAEIVRGPMIASFAVTAADPSGLIGLVQEATATGRALAEAKTAGDGSLAAEVAAIYETAEGRALAREGVQSLVRGHTPAEATTVAIGRLSEVARILDEYAAEAASSYKDWLRQIARRVAEAAREGGFLGFGGVAVSEAETKTLADIDIALDDNGSPFEDGDLPV